MGSVSLLHHLISFGKDQNDYHVIMIQIFKVFYYLYVSYLFRELTCLLCSFLCSVLGGPEYMEVLMNMEKGSPSLTGEVLFTDARLVANGFQIRLTPGSTFTVENE